jgi:O-antigen/teichoic acid export membrane protein
MPVMILTGIVAEEFFFVLYGEKWLDAVPYFRLLCIVGALYPLQTINLNILKVKSRSDLFLRLSVIKIGLSLGVLWYTKDFGVETIILGQVGVAVVSLFLNSLYSGLLIGYSLIAQAKDLLPGVLIALLSGVLTYFLKESVNIENRFLALAVWILAYLIPFLTLSYVTKQKSVLYLLRRLRILCL